MRPPTSTTDARGQLLADAGRCVKCALCLPHCPTYGLKGEEGDSPRGRIALIQALAEGSLEPTAATREHLEGCLTCRACEAVCPAGVPYGRLIDMARATLPVRGRSGLVSKAVRRAARTPRLLKVLLRLGRVLARMRVPIPGGALLAGAGSQRMPRAQGPREGTPVQLFLGCVARALDADALSASATLLAAAGYRVEVPTHQTCCGALAMHAGEHDAAAGLARRNLRAFSGAAPVVGTASGCTAQLLEYDRVLAEGRPLAKRVTDISTLLSQALATGKLTADQPGEPVRVGLHVPCTERNVMRSNAARHCLEALPNVEVVELPPGCCGSAGSYSLDRPEDAVALRRLVIEAINAAGVSHVVTTNVGCRLHVAAGLQEEGAPAIEHLATFLERRLRLGPAA